MWKGKVAKREQDIAIALKAHNAKEHLVGENLPEAHHVFHVQFFFKLQFHSPSPSSLLKNCLMRVSITLLTGAPYLILFQKKEKEPKLLGATYLSFLIVRAI